LARACFVGALAIAVLAVFATAPKTVLAMAASWACGALTTPPKALAAMARSTRIGALAVATTRSAVKSAIESAVARRRLTRPWGGGGGFRNEADVLEAHAAADERAHARDAALARRETRLAADEERIGGERLELERSIAGREDEIARLRMQVSVGTWRGTSTTVSLHNHTATA